MLHAGSSDMMRFVLSILKRVNSISQYFRCFVHDQTNLRSRGRFGMLKISFSSAFFLFYEIFLDSLQFGYLFIKSLCFNSFLALPLFSSELMKLFGSLMSGSFSFWSLQLFETSLFVTDYAFLVIDLFLIFC